MIPVVSSGGFTVLSGLSTKGKKGNPLSVCRSAASARMMVTMVISASVALQLNAGSEEQLSQRSSHL
jgi:hypothetical protein